MVKTTESRSPIELSATIKRLGDLLGEVIRDLEGEETFKLVERIRKLSKGYRSGKKSDLQKIQLLIKQLSTEQCSAIAMAFSTYFELINIAEDLYRISVLRTRRRQSSPKKPMGESIAEALAMLKKRGAKSGEIQDILNQLHVEPVFTAHPTEAKRRTVLQKLRRVSEALLFENKAALPGLETDRLIHRIITTLWLTDRIRSEKPLVRDEVKMVLWYVQNILWDTVPLVHADLIQALKATFPTVRPPEGWIKFGSWVGGDRDGHSGVTPEVTQNTLEQHRKAVLDQLRTELKGFGTRMSLSDRREHIPTFIHEFVDKLPSFPGKKTYPHEPYRSIFSYLNTLRENKSLKLGYLREIVSLVSKGLETGKARALVDGDIRNFKFQVEVFGFHMMRLDLRQHSENHEKAVALLTSKDYPELTEAEKIERVTQAIQQMSSDSLPENQAPQEARPIIHPFAIVHTTLQENPQALGLYIVSMTESVSDILEVAFLMNLCGGRLPIAPLFETIDDLERAPKILEALFENEAYQKHLRLTGMHQHVMLGYSDSNKDGGIMMSRWALFRVQDEIARVCERAKIPFTLFHGRGGTIERGGGEIIPTLRSQPSGLKSCTLRLTEQGEVLSRRYHHIEIAHRVLEQMTHGLLLASFDARHPSPIPAPWSQLMDEMSREAQRMYRSFVYENPDFISFWHDMTPISEIPNLNIGSRPSSRKSFGKVEDIRAIPWVFSWLQNRTLLPAWYGVGTALEKGVTQNSKTRSRLIDMYKKWPFFQAFINDVQRALAITEIEISRCYLDLSSDRKKHEALFENIHAEYQRTRKHILLVTQQKSFLSKRPVIMNSIQRRNPYVDPLNLIQIEMMNRLRQKRDPDVLNCLHLTISGISTGLKNTG